MAPSNSIQIHPIIKKLPQELVLSLLLFLLLSASFLIVSKAQQSTPYVEPRWMAKIRARSATAQMTNASAITVGPNVNVSNEPGPQSEVFVAVSTQNPSILAAASNEI